MFVARSIVERPVTGGEMFSATIGPSRAARRALRWLRGASAASVALGFGLLARGSGGAGLAVAGVLLAVLAVAEWVAGGAESLVCQGAHLVHRRRRLRRERRRTLPVLAIRRIRPQRDGLRIETEGSGWAVGPGLAWPEANDLAQALERHLRLSGPEVLARTASDLGPPRGAAATRPAPARPEAVLRLRNPPGH